jgi:trimeric autotransporter adhesin
MRVRVALLAAIVVAGVPSHSRSAVQPTSPAGEKAYRHPDRPIEGTPLAQREFFRPDLYISSANVALADLLPRLPNRAAWESLHGTTAAYIDPRSGAATSLVGVFPMIPGTGQDNRITLAEVSGRLGRPVTAIDEDVVASLVLAFARQRAEILGIDPDQFGEARARTANPDLWHIRIPQVFRGVPVRHGQLVAVISHGNLVLTGTETWGNVRIDAKPTLTAAQALDAGFAFADGRQPEDVLIDGPTLEVIPYAPSELQDGDAYAGPVGAGYRHRLVWSFRFRRPPEIEQWEVLVAADDGDILAFEDKNHYATRQVTGGVYPLTSTDICPTTQTCGVMQLGWPMPWANTGLPAPNDFANSAGLFDYTSGTVTSSLAGRYATINDTCGPILLGSATGDLAFGGTPGDHDCTTPGFGGAGNTAAARSAYYATNRLAEMGRGYLPSNTWLQAALPANVNLTQSCGGFWNGTSVNFCLPAPTSRNPGENRSVIAHEWGHGLDDNDTGGALSSSSEAYGDIASILTLQASCLYHGLHRPSTPPPVCGLSLDGSGNNANEAMLGPPHCDIDCSGSRDADWAKHSPAGPDTALGFVCSSCASGGGPCGREVHCAAAPARQAAWDLAARDLQAPPFNMSRTTAFIVASRLFFQGSGGISAWHSCTCGGSSNGCGASNGYMMWLAADDDDGNLGNGTPHMTALFAAFDRHQIACPTPAPLNGGCSGGPTAAATLSGTAGNGQVALSWTAVPGATRYRIFRGEGHAGCDIGKALIAEVLGLAYTDAQLADGRPYSYNVIAAGANTSCFGAASNCVTVTPFALAAAPQALAVDTAGNGVYQPNETVVVAPTWLNTGTQALALNGAFTNHTGPAGPTYAIPDAAASYGTIAVGGNASCTATGNCYSLANSAATRPQTHWDSTVVETVTPTSTAKTWTLHVGNSFSEVPPTSPFFRFIETLLHRGVTGGCTPTTYCPSSSTTREQMAVFVILSKEPPGYVPPGCVAGAEAYDDVPATSPFCRWIEELSRRGVVSGCGGGNYCPASPVSREQMAIFVLKTLDPALVPPACAPPNLYLDVPETSPFCRWIEELTTRGVVSGCGGGNYCPTQAVTREQMGVFLAVTFGLTLYGL